jgi:hypothetical protein
MKSLRKVPFSVMQDICCERHFEYKGTAGRFDTSCHNQGCHDNRCDIEHCPNMSMIGDFKPVSFDQFQKFCKSRNFRSIRDDIFYVSCKDQDKNSENRCNHRQCPVWNKRCFSLEENVRHVNSEVVRDSEVVREKTDISEISMPVIDHGIISLRQLNCALKNVCEN